MPKERAPEAPWLSRKQFQFLNQFVRVILPGMGTLYFALATLWDLPNPDKVVGTFAAIAVFLGLFLNQSVKQYNTSDARYDGEMVVTTQDDGSQMMSLELNGDPKFLETKPEVRFKVVPSDDFQV